MRSTSCLNRTSRSPRRRPSRREQLNLNTVWFGVFFMCKVTEYYHHNLYLEDEHEGFSYISLFCSALASPPYRTQEQAQQIVLCLKSTWISIVCSSMQTAQWAMGWLAEPVHHMRQTYIWSLQWLIYCQRWHYFHTLVSIYSCFRAVLCKILKKMLLSLAARHHLYCPVRAFFLLAQKHHWWEQCKWTKKLNY